MLNDDYAGSLHSTVPDVFKCPDEKKYGTQDFHLLPEIKKLRMTMNTDWKCVKKFLDQCQREVIETKPRLNNALEAILMQLHVPKDFKVHMLRHLVAEHFALYPDFFAPKMEKYLKESKIGYNRYVYGVYNRDIWCDEYILGAIVHMFNIRISIISPRFSDLWHVYHNGKEDPDVILVANGRGFRTEFNRFTHFSATKGSEHQWRCVGSNLELQPVEKYSGFVEGQSMALDFDTINQSKSIVSKSQDILHNVNKLCQDIQKICIDRDQIIKDLKDLDIKVGNFRKLTSFYIQDKVAEFMTRQKIPATKRKLEIFPSDPGAIPKVHVKDIRQTETGQKILAQSGNKQAEQLNETNIGHMKQKMSTSHSERSCGRTKRTSVEGSEQLTETTNISHMKQKMSTTHSGKVSDGTKRKNVEESMQNKSSTNVQQLVESEQGSRDDAVPPKKCCRIKCRGRTVHAPMLVQDPRLPSLGEYSRMITTPEKNPVQEK